MTDMHANDVVFSETPGENAIPRQLVEPTYQNRLRVLGRFIDEQRLHSITLIEVAGGYILRANREHEPWPEILELDELSIGELLARGPAQRGREQPPRLSNNLVPNGYEDLLRAIGYEFDLRIAENIVVDEIPSLIAISGFVPVLGFGESSYHQFSEPLGHQEIIELMQQAISRRGSYQHTQRYIPPNFRG